MISRMLDCAVIGVTRPRESLLGVEASAVAVHPRLGRGMATSHATSVRAASMTAFASANQNQAWPTAKVSAYAPRHLKQWGSARDPLQA